MKRGTIKSFREYLNRKFADHPNHRNGVYRQQTRGYGDYLYNQDRPMFETELQLALDGHECYSDWSRP